MREFKYVEPVGYFPKEIRDRILKESNQKKTKKTAKSTKKTTAKKSK